MENANQDEKTRKKILDDAIFLHNEALHAYSIYLVIETLVRCARKYGEEMCVSPYFYSSFYSLGTEHIFMAITKCCDSSGNENNICIHSLLTCCEKNMHLFPPMMLYRYENDTQDTQIPYSIYVKKSLKLLYEGFLKGESSVQMPEDFVKEMRRIDKFWLGVENPNSTNNFKRMEGDFQCLFHFLEGALKERASTIQNTRMYRNKIIAHNDRKADEWLNELRKDKENARWERIEDVLLILMNLTDLIVSALRNEKNFFSIMPFDTGDEKKDAVIRFKTAYGSAGDIEKTLLFVRQAIVEYPPLLEEHLNAQFEAAMRKDNK